MADLVVKSKAADYVRSKGMNVSSDLYAALDTQIASILDGAVTRCKGNKRKTVRGFDL